MPHELLLTHQGQVVEAHFHGVVTTDERTQALDALLRRHYETLLDKFLVDFSDARMGAPSEAEVVHYASRIVREPSLRGLRVAIVCAINLPGQDEERIVLRSPSFQRFPSREAALQWLGVALRPA